LRIALREHGELWSGMDASARMLGEGERSAPATSVCQTLLAQLAAHNAKEEPVVHPKTGHVLSVKDTTNWRSGSARSPAPVQRRAEPLRTGHH
jgi:hypothetical protein